METMIFAALIGIVSVARTARLIVWDEYPPTIWLRIKWDDFTHDSAWNKLLHCQFCLTPYMAAVMFAWYYFSDGHWTWWVINGIWAASYLSAILVAFDQPEE